MKIVKQSYSILSKINGDEMLKSIERAGRTCYKSEDKITNDSAERFVKMLIVRGHESVLEHETISVTFVCDRAISHEIVRHRLASFSQSSTRYCNYSKDKFNNEITVVRPFFFPVGTAKYNDWLEAMKACEKMYLTLIERGATAQEARSVLPNSLKTDIVVTANIREWRAIFKQRTAKAAHPQMRELMCPLLDELKETIPAVFTDITY